MMLLKLVTSNVPQVRHNFTPTVQLPWHQFCFRVYFVFDWRSRFLLLTPNELVRKRRVIWALRAFQVGLSAFTGRKWRYLFRSRKELGPRVIPWQGQNGCHFVSYLRGVHP